MKYSKLFGKTVKEVSADAKLASHKLLYQAGFIRESVAGRYYFLPLGIRVQDKLMKIVEEEMDKAGAQKMITPVLHPMELWDETNRSSSVGFELMSIQDQRGAKFALGGTAEEMMVDVVRKFNVSYKDLPFNIYQFSQKFRDELRARGGLLRVREFMMKDAYSFHADEEDFKKEYQSMWQTYSRIFERVGLQSVVIESDNGYIGGDYCHEFVVESDAGESRYLISEDKTYAAHEEVAVFARDEKNLNDELKTAEVVEVKRGNSIEEGCRVHQNEAWQHIKSVLYFTDQNEPVLAVIRGDLDINEIKLKHVLKCFNLRMANDEEITALGTVVGYISPLKLKIKKVGDLSLKTVRNFITGADEFGKDTLNVNYERDFTVDHFADIAMPPDDAKTQSGQKLVEGKGIEVGNIFQLGTHYTTLMKDSEFTDAEGNRKPYYMGCYGIGIGRTLATIVEIHHDEKGIVWPKSITPYHVHLVSLGKDESVSQAADKLYADLEAAGIEVLYDDRDKQAGAKLADADLIGIPLRLVISNRTLEAQAVEWKERNKAEAEQASLSGIVEKVKHYYK